MTASIPRVSIGMPVYNGEPYIKETIESLLTQTLSDFELVISDNASTDGTEDICRAYSARDPRVRYYRNEKNLGLAGNYNRVFSLARGEYFKWTPADDVCQPSYLDRCVEVLDRDSTVVLAYPRTLFVDAEGRPLDIHDPGWHLRSDAAQERMRYVIFACHWVNSIVGLIRVSALRKTRMMPAYSGGDYGLLGELSLLGKFYEIPETLLLRRLHPNSTSQHGTSGTNPDPKWLIRCWTGTDGSVSLPHWALNIDHFRTITRSQLSFRQKLSLMRSLLRHMRWQRGKLSRELWDAITACFPTASTPSSSRQGGEYC